MRYRYENTYYQPAKHLYKRYKQRMADHVKTPEVKKNIQCANEEELTRRANYMLIFSVHGRPGDTAHTEVRFYFDWNIVIDNRDKTIVTLYQDRKRKIPPIESFGDRKLRRTIYNLWFKPKSKMRKAIAG